MPGVCCLARALRARPRRMRSLLRHQNALRRPTAGAVARGVAAAPPHLCAHDGTRAQRSLILLKPDAVARRLVGRILQRFEDRGLAIVGLRRRTAARALAEAHYAEHRERPFFGRACVFLCSGPLVSVAIEGARAARTFRLLGSRATLPRSAPPGRERGERVSAPPRVLRGYSVEAGRGAAAGAARTFRGGASRQRRVCRVDHPRRGNDAA